MADTMEDLLLPNLAAQSADGCAMQVIGNEDRVPTL